MRPTDYICKYMHVEMLSGPYINPANQAPGVQTGHIPAINTGGSHRLIMGTTLKIFSEIMRPTDNISGDKNI